MESIKLNYFINKEDIIRLRLLLVIYQEVAIQLIPIKKDRSLYSQQPNVDSLCINKNLNDFHNHCYNSKNILLICILYDFVRF